MASPICRATTRACRRRFPSSARRFPAISANQSLMPAPRRTSRRPDLQAAARCSGAGGSAHQPSLRDDKHRTGRACGHPGIDRRAGGRARHRLSRSDVAGSQARLSEWQCRSSHWSLRSSRQPASPAAGGRGDPCGSNHGTAFRPAWPGHRPDHRGCLRQSDRSGSPDPARRASDRPCSYARSLAPGRSRPVGLVAWWCRTGGRSCWSVSRCRPAAGYLRLEG